MLIRWPHLSATLSSIWPLESMYWDKNYSNTLGNVRGSDWKWFQIFRVTHNKWWIIEVQGIGWPKWDTSLVLIWTSSSTTCFNSHWLPQRTPQLPLVTFENLCQNCKHAMSHLGLKIGVTKRLASQLGVVTLPTMIPWS
jgi:hypothetical protein